MSRSSVGLSIGLVGLFLVLGIPSALHTRYLVWLLVHTSYYFMWALFLVVAHEFFITIPTSSKGFSRWAKDHAFGASLSAIITILIVIAVKPDLRVLGDEANLLSVSRSMTYLKTIHNSMMGLWYYDSYWSVMDLIDKRPFFYPFLVSLVHGLFGYSVKSAFVVNGFILFCLLNVAFIIGRKSRGVLFGIAAQLLCVAQPIVVLCATSAGMDFLFAVDFLAMLLFIYLYLDKPTGKHLGFLWISLLVLANSRYEGGLYCSLVVVALLLLGAVSWKAVKERIVLISATPLLCLPIAWQAFVKWGDEENPVGVSVFCRAHFVSNIKELWMGMIHPDVILPYAAVLNALGLFGFTLVFHRVFVNRKKNPAAFKTLLIGMLLLGSLMVLILSYFWGHYDHPASGRYFLVPALLLSFLPLMVAAKYPSVRVEYILSLGLVLALSYWPVASENRFSNSLDLTRELHVVEQFLASQPDHNIVLVSGRPGEVTIFNYGAVGFDYFRANDQHLKRDLDRHLFAGIYAAQWIEYATQKPILEDNLPPGWKLQTVVESSYDELRYLRISKLTD